jgi:NADPH-dependent ferric siderophore reductase
VSLRSYTARRQDPAAAQVEIDFVLHGDGPRRRGPRPPPGRRSGVGRGRRARRPAGRALLLAGDETALPGDQPDPRRRTAGPAASRCSRSPGRGGAAAARAGGIASAGCTAGHRRPGRARCSPTPSPRSTARGDDVFAWVAAESAAVRTIRADLRGRWGWAGRSTTRSGTGGAAGRMSPAD